MNLPDSPSSYDVCTVAGCSRGFLPSRLIEGAVTPCPMCKGDLVEVLATLPDPGRRSISQMCAISERYRGGRSGL